MLAATLVTLSVAAPAARAQGTYGPELMPFSDFLIGSMAYVADPGDPINGIPATFLSSGPQGFDLQFATDPSQLYRLSFDWSFDPYYFGDGVFRVFWGSTPLIDLMQFRSGQSSLYLLPGNAGMTNLRFEVDVLGSCTGGICDDWGVRAGVSNASLTQVIATPEPATIALTASGLGLVGMLGWRRRRAA